MTRNFLLQSASRVCELHAGILYVITYFFTDLLGAAVVITSDFGLPSNKLRSRLHDNDYELYRLTNDTLAGLIGLQVQLTMSDSSVAVRCMASCRHLQALESWSRAACGQRPRP